MAVYRRVYGFGHLADRLPIGRDRLRSPTLVKASYRAWDYLLPLFYRFTCINIGLSAFILSVNLSAPYVPHSTSMYCPRSDAVILETSIALFFTYLLHNEE